MFEMTPLFATSLLACCELGQFGSLRAVFPSAFRFLSLVASFFLSSWLCEPLASSRASFLLLVGGRGRSLLKTSRRSRLKRSRLLAPLPPFRASFALQLVSLSGRRRLQPPARILIAGQDSKPKKLAMVKGNKKNGPCSLYLTNTLKQRRRT